MKMTSTSGVPRLPVAVQLGFAGSRHMFDPQTAADPDALDAAARDFLVERLRTLPGELGFTNHFLCGVSQVAIGADTHFTEACRILHIPQRIFLPQRRDEYLAASSASGVADFTDSQRTTARELLESVHVIEERVVSHEPNRSTRFEEVNLELARVSDVVLCVVRPDADGRTGGTLDLLEAARRRGKPVLKIELRFEDGVVVPKEQWYGAVVLPQLPPDIADAGGAASEPEPPPSGVPMTAVTYADALKAAGSGRASQSQKIFRRMAFAIVGAHVLATVCALIALMTHDHWALPWLLGFELLLLVTGFTVHTLLHRWHALRVWAMARLVAEVARSVKSLRHVHRPLDYLFALPYPAAMQPLLRTIEVLHLASTRLPSPAWGGVRDAYVEERLTGRHGQVPYYTRTLTAEGRLLSWFTRLFYTFSFTAIASTLLKLTPPGHDPRVVPFLAFYGVLMPVLAVSALSLAASFDLEARVHTFQETLSVLHTAVPLLGSAQSEREFIRIAFETEAQLLGETANWASRRSFTSIT